MYIKQFRYSLDNLGYLIYGDKEAIAIDGGAVDQIRAFVNNNGLKLKIATNTHSHADHTRGTSELVRKLNSSYQDHTSLMKKGKMFLEDEEIMVLHTPGHTMDAVTFYTGSYMITGDTLFNGTVGNCFSGRLDAFYNSIKQLLSFSDNTIVYAGHDYVEESIAFARQLEPDNPNFETYLEKYDPVNVHSLLSDEYKVNPYLRFNHPSIIDMLKRKGLPVETELQRWQSVMAL